MQVFLRKPRCKVFAEGEYDPSTKKMLVKKGAVVSEDIRLYKSGATSKVSVCREKLVKNNVLIKDTIFESSSGAAIFLTGRSTNGLEAWKDEKGVTLYDLIGKGDR